MSKQVSMATFGIGMLAAVILGAVGHYFVVVNETGNQMKTYPVRLIPVAGKDSLEVSVRDDRRRCKADDNNGCMAFSQDKIGHIKFFIEGSKFDNKGCRNSDAVITKIVLSTSGKGDKGNFGGPVDDWIKDDAFPAIDKETGVVYEARPRNARTQVYLTNMNSNSAEEPPKTFWYQVTVSACPGKPGGPWTSDPRGVNKGTN